ncbi:MFS transporter, partial [Candidatus Bipolaricaulota bacterium]|nr:MFS transporter [Candidatus Bipolaricaulota bacterium]
MVRIFASLFFATATAQLGLGIISPILPLYAKTFAASATEIGLVFTAFSISRALLGPFVGRLSDRIGRRPIILTGLVIYAVVSVLYASAESLWTLGLFRFIQGVASVMVTPIAQAYVGDLTPKGREGRYLNAFYASQFIGMAFGPLLGGVIGSMWSYDAAFYAMGGLSVLSLVLVFLTVPVDQTAREHRQPKLRTITPLRQVVSSDGVKAMLAYFITRGFWRQSFNAFYPLYAVVAFAVDEASVGLVLSTYMFAEGLLQVPFGFLADRFPRIRQIVVGSVFAPLILLAVPYVGSPWAVALLTFGMGAFSALGRASLVAIRTELGRTHGMATLAGLQGSAFAVGQALGPLMSGAVVDLVGVVAVFPFGSGVGCLGTVLVLIWLRRWLRSDPDAPAM